MKYQSLNYKSIELLDSDWLALPGSKTGQKALSLGHRVLGLIKPRPQTDVRQPATSQEIS